MSTTGDIVNRFRDVLLPVGLPVIKYQHEAEQEGTERIVINTIPNRQVRFGSGKQNNDVVNVNVFVPKLDGRVDSARIDSLDAQIQSILEDPAATTRVGYNYLNPQPGTVFNESDKESLLNIRVETTYT